MSDVPALPRFEANLVQIARFFVRGLPASQAGPLLAQRCERPRCLSRTAVALVRDALAKGCVRRLARTGGWQRERHLRSNEIANGRLWQRTAPRELGLHFSRQTLQMLLWFTAENAEDDKSRRSPVAPEGQTAADALVCYDAYTALRDTPAGPALPVRLGFANQALCWLAFPDDFMQRPSAAVPDFSAWLAGVGPCLLEALQPELAECVVRLERRKAELADWRTMQTVGKAQELVLQAFHNDVRRAGRLDLARFLLAASKELLPDGKRLSDWTPNLSEAGPRLADRAATLHAALVVPRLLIQLRQAERDARGVGYFDEGYAAAQLWKSEWERFGGEQLAERAEGLLKLVAFQ